MAPEPLIRYVRCNFDEAAILAVAAKLTFDSSPSFSETELATIGAMQRAHPCAGDTPEALGHWLADMNEDQLRGVVSNTKGALHEMEFVRLENSDGDTVHACLFGQTNQPGFDIQLIDETSGLSWYAQLKSSDSTAYVQDWVDAHPGGEILVTDELALAMGLPGSGLSNGELKVRVEDLVDRLQETGNNGDLWQYFPALTAVSVALVVWTLFQRYQCGEIEASRFRSLAARATGLKAAKIGGLMLAMSIPGINVITGAALVSSLIYSGAVTFRSAGSVHI